MDIELARPLEIATYGENIEKGGNLSFAHFSNPKRCAEFLDFLRKKHIAVKRTCCNGCGCLIPNKSNKDIKLLVSRFNLENPIPKMLICEETTDTDTIADSDNHNHNQVIDVECGVCLKDMNGINMVNVCSIANHDTCVTCYTHLKSMAFSCPFCRGKLK
jgi:hypothetical protein